MITTEGLATTLKNGKEGKATTSVTGYGNYGTGKLILQQLNDDVSIGDRPKPEQVDELPSITIEFSDPKSIDVYIKALLWIKDKMENGSMQYYLAC